MKAFTFVAILSFAVAVFSQGLDLTTLQSLLSGLSQCSQNCFQQIPNFKLDNSFIVSVCKDPTGTINTLNTCFTNNKCTDGTLVSSALAGYLTPDTCAAIAAAAAGNSTTPSTSTVAKNGTAASTTAAPAATGAAGNSSGNATGNSTSTPAATKPSGAGRVETAIVVILVSIVAAFYF
ncbi:hypothetical protein HDU97_009234 [Phlyctochytrium planicorne]|nr:hypothetical protein HDU97_009234 [Phlyctochytrium planicorne]